MEKRPVWMEGSAVCAIDQRLLPHARVVLRWDRVEETVLGIREMAVRGAGTIGVAAGYAMAQAALSASPDSFWEEVEGAARLVRGARPTARNLFYAVERVLCAAKSAAEVESARRAAVEEAQAIERDDIRMTGAIARAGLPLMPVGRRVLTHCNAGWLAYPGWGTALAPIYLAHEQRQSIFVVATETRPRSQGAKLTVWELKEAGIPHLLIADTAAGSCMRSGEVGLVIVGADRIAANGDTANKIGTYTLAVLAKAHGIPFYVAAPSPTFDGACPSGADIPIEERGEEEVVEVSGAGKTGEGASVRIAPAGVRAGNPAFDVTPAALITGFVTEHGVIPAVPTEIAGFLAKAQTLLADRASSLARTR